MDQKQSSLDNNNSQQEQQQQYPEQYNETARQRTGRQDIQCTQEPASYYQQDVRMKRHPELQPYVPSDRFNRIVPKTSSSLMTTSSTGLPKKYCSMSRLNQLAQPKNKKSTRDSQDLPQRHQSHLQQQQQQQHQQPPQQRAQTQSQRPLSQQPRPQPPQQQHQQQRQQPKQQSKQPTPQQQSQQKHGQKQQQSQSFHKHQQQPQQTKRLSDRPQPITPLTSAKPTTMITPLSPTSVLPTQTPKSSTPVVRTPRETPSTPAVQLPTPASSLEEELESANKTRDIMSIVSEMSINDPFYQSAASELVPDSEKSNGNNYDRNAESLCREFEQDLIAKGILHETGDDLEDEFRSPMSNGRNDSPRRTSVATIVTSDTLARPGESPHGYDEDDRRLKIEKELREKAKKEDEDRKEREQLVESILSRFSQGSVS